MSAIKCFSHHVLLPTFIRSRSLHSHLLSRSTTLCKTISTYAHRNENIIIIKKRSAVHMPVTTIKQKHKAEKKHRPICSHITRLQLMAYSDGTSGCGPNICTHDLSCSPQGQSVEKYCVCACSSAMVILLACFHTHPKPPEATEQK